MSRKAPDSRTTKAALRTRARTTPIAPVFAALGDDLRLRILQRLSADGRASITTLTRGSRVTRQAVTKHLHVLASAGLVRSSRHGREQLWELTGEPLLHARRQLDLIAGQWDRALLRLKTHLEHRPA